MTESSRIALAEPEVGSYFVANYPPFSVWTREAVARDARPALDAPPAPACRSACTCTSRSAGSAVTSATSASTRTRTRRRSSSISICSRASGSCTAQQPAIAGRPLDFVYFGGGTPSFLSTQQLESLVERLTADRALDRGRGDHVRVRAGHADRGQARRDPAAGRHAAQPRRRELRRSRSSSSTAARTDRRRSAAPTTSRARSTFRRSTST